MDIIALIAENKIRMAIENGEFNDLPLKGKPINLSDYFKIPQNLRIAYDLLHKAGLLPEEVTLNNQIEEIKKKVKTCQDKSEVKTLLRHINYITMQLNLKKERFSKKYKRKL